MSSYDNHDEAIAVVGIGCRLPGRVKSLESFWDLFVDVLAGRDGIIEVPKDRWNLTPSKRVTTMNGETVSRGAPHFADLTNLDGERE